MLSTKNAVRARGVTGKAADRRPADKNSGSFGAKARIDCFECIPCNPCESACPVGAIKIGSAIYNTPALDTNICIGCGRCVSRCSGLAITVINRNYSDSDVSLELPYEYLPLPRLGSEVTAVDREGNAVCKARVEKIREDRNTHVIKIVFDKQYADIVRSIKRGEY